MQMIIDLPDTVLASVNVQAGEARIEASEWIAEVLVKVIRTNEIHYMRKDVIDWSEELLS